MGDKWGKTHCAACGKAYFSYSEYKQRISEVGVAEAEEWMREYCPSSRPFVCMNGVIPTMISLRERIDELEAQLGEKKATT